MKNTIFKNLLPLCRDYFLVRHTALADLGGGRAGRMPPYGTKFFRFCIHFCQKAPTSEVHTPSNGSMPPLREILDPPLYSMA